MLDFMHLGYDIVYVYCCDLEMNGELRELIELFGLCNCDI